MSENRIPLSPGNYYHIYNHANGDENLFRERENYLHFLKKYALYINPLADTFAYCLMPNHFHFFIRVKSKEELLFQFSSTFQGTSTLQGVHSTLEGLKSLERLESLISKKFSHFFNGYTQAYNRRFNRMGSLFIPRFKRKEVETILYFRTLVQYIHLNPVSHGFTNAPGDWEFSSYNSYLSAVDSDLKKEDVMNWFDDNLDFITLHNQNIPEELFLEMEF